VTAQIWRIEQHEEYAGSCQYRTALQWKPLALSGLNLSPEKATIERGHKMALESNLASRLVFHWTGRAFTLAL
jgi:hypothetical protein